MLVVAVVFVFLQDWRATLIPTIAIPVSLIGVFAVLYMLGYSANTVNLFAIVLAITLVVDDAIVVVENVARTLEEHPEMPPAEATERAMAEIAAPVIATTLVLVAVFAPVGFVSGITGALYRQFAVTISVSVVISAVNALTLSPALCALLLRPPKGRRFFAFRLFNRGFDIARNGYGVTVRLLSRWLILAWAGVAASLVLAYLVFGATPTAFLPNEDQGYFYVNMQTPSGASLARTQQVVSDIGQLLRKTPGVAHTIELAGFSLVSGAQEPNAGSVIAIMQPWDQRPESQSTLNVIERLRPELNAIPAANIVSFNPPAIPGISTTGGINFVLEGRNGQSYQDLAQVSRAVIFAANQNPDLSSVFTSFSANVPQLRVDIDTAKAALLGVTPLAIYQTLQANLGGQFVNLFNYQNLRLSGRRAGRGAIPPEDQRHRQSVRPQQRRQDGAARRAGNGQRGARPERGQHLQSVSGGADQRRRRVRQKLGPGDRGDGAGRETASAAGLRLRMDRDVVSGIAGSRAAGRRVSGRDRVFLPVSGGAVRELDIAAVGDAAGRVCAARAASARSCCAGWRSTSTARSVSCC